MLGYRKKRQRVRSCASVDNSDEKPVHDTDICPFMHTSIPVHLIETSTLTDFWRIQPDVWRNWVKAV